METRHTTDTTNASDTNQTMHGRDTEPEHEPKEPVLLRWPHPAGALPEFSEVCVELIDPAKRANRGPINTLQKAVSYVADVLAASCVEKAAVILINNKGIPAGYSIVSMGCELSCRLSPAEIARLCILSGCVRVVMMHNHPNDADPQPSRDDDSTAIALREILRQVGLILIDFIIVGVDSLFFSYRENQRGPFMYDAAYTDDEERYDDPEEDEDYDGPDDGQN